MKSTFFRTALRGALFLIPIIGVGYLLSQIFKTIDVFSENVIETTIIETKWQFTIALLLTVIILLILIYVFGRFSQSKAFAHFSEAVDEELINLSPTYRSFKLEIDNQARFLVENRPPIFVAFGNKERPGFLIDEHPNEQKAVVFIPKNFNKFNGNVYVVSLNEIRYAHSSTEDFVKALDHVGDGLDIS